MASKVGIAYVNIWGSCPSVILFLLNQRLPLSAYEALSTSNLLIDTKDVAILI
ncbi:hypothetical protein T11_5561 [Trichinella zimbabwensis]|uniref:Uncharacterized protein n=1 Tax=Trichinella zimbabwensis TaxID=268475 RepID=A0A0V1GL64_9BILA|nr:hypothetical protein T11_13316 [Trichinella zimbabwensis]KRY98711.1 hypothetical protein T11_5561 [Trichinella zimbabwensis]